MPRLKTSSDEVNQRIGEMIRQRRKALNLSQQKLADLLDISFQQVQKYENGSNRVSASTLLQLSQALQAPIPFFFGSVTVMEEEVLATPVLTARERQEILHSVNRIEDATAREKALQKLFQ